MRRTYVCSLCGNRVILHIQPSEPPTCSNRKHREVKVMKEVGDPQGVTRRVLAAMSGMVECQLNPGGAA